MRARLDLSRSCSWFWRVVSGRLAIIWLMLSLSWPTSPGASTAIARERSPLVTAVATSAMARTWVVRLPASWFTFSVIRFQVPNTPSTSAWSPSLPSGLTARVDGDPLREVATGHRGGHLGDVADLVGEVVGHGVDRVGQVAPGARDALDVGLAAELALGAHLARHPGHLVGEGGELVDHGVDGVLQLGDLAARLDGDLLRQVALGHRGGHLGDVADLGGQVAREQVDVLGEVLPGARHAGNGGLAAELALGAHLARHPRHLVGERAELVDHGVDDLADVLELALHRAALDR